MFKINLDKIRNKEGSIAELSSFIRNKLREIEKNSKYLSDAQKSKPFVSIFENLESNGNAIEPNNLPQNIKAEENFINAFCAISREINKYLKNPQNKQYARVLGITNNFMLYIKYQTFESLPEAIDSVCKQIESLL